MPERLTHSKANEILKTVDLPALISARTAENKTNMVKLAKAIGRSESYLYTKLKNADQPASLLLLLSNHLQCNVFEPYVNLLPENRALLNGKKHCRRKLPNCNSKQKHLLKSGIFTRQL